MKAFFGSIFLILFLLTTSMIKAQNNCASAVNIPIEVYGTCGDMAFTNVDFNGAVPSADAPAPTCGNFSAATKDMWYSFTVPSGVTQMAFHAFNAPPPIIMLGPPACGPGMAVYTGTCGSLNLLGCFNESDGLMQNGEIRWELLNVTPGTTIYVRLWEEDNDATSMFFAASVLTSLPESDCANPPELGTSGCNILAPAGTIQAPGDCSWNSTDNVVFYSFEVLATDPQPVVLEIEYGQCWANENAGPIPIPATVEIQLAVYSWNGINCTNIGGSPASDPPNNTGSYHGCANGTGTVTYTNNLAPGQYLLAMDGFSDVGGNSLCTFGIAASFLEPDPEELNVSLSTINNACGQVGSASITVNSSCNGNPTIAWSNGDFGANTTNLAAGNYSVTITDDAPCGDTIINFTITTITNFAVSITTTGNPCIGPVTATANVMGANPGNVTFAWTGGSHSQNLVLTAPGTYTVTATYGSCIDTDSYTLIDANFDFSVNYTPIICAGSTGAAQFNLISGTGPFMYEWSGGVGTLIGPGVGINAPGNYCLTVTDMASHCQLTKCFTVTQVPAVSVAITKKDITCFNFNDGEVTALATGGTPDYTYVWNGYIHGASMNNLISGNYSVVVTDDNGCTGAATTFVENPEQFFYNISPNQGICFGDQADIHVNAVGGILPYLYSWNDSPAMNSSDRTVSPPNTTQYTVTVYDANGCQYPAQSTTVIVSQPIIINVDIEDLDCHSVCNGSAVLNIEGGVPPFVYSWGSSTNYFENLCAGDYSVSLTDQYGCAGSANFIITEPDTIYLSINSGPATCWGYNNGFAEVGVIGGVPFTNEFGSFYQYQWSNGMTQDSINVGFGYYNVTVSDANGCKHIATAFIDQPPAIFVTPAWGGRICIGESFTTQVNATGGTVINSSSYDFVWLGSDGTIWYGPSLTVSPIITTSYQLITNDDSGCFAPIQNITVQVNPVINISGTSTSLDDICIGESIIVEMVVEGGNGGPYTINMQHSGIINMPYTFYPQTTGYYSFTVSDNCGSPTDKDSIYVVVHPLPQAGFFADHTSSCPPGVFQFTETTPDYGQTYLWDFGDGGFSVQKNPTHTYSKTGTYPVSITVWSEFGCKRTRSYNNMIFIHPTPRAEFTALPELVSVLNGQVELTNYSDGATTFFWDFGDGSTSMWTTEMQMHTYYEVGEFDIMLVAKNQYECLDSIYKKIRIHDEYAFYAPDAFTPNGDGVNDLFYVIGHGIDKSQFRLVIYDRFGSKVFETEIWDEENPHRMAWDGSHNGSVSKGDKIISNGMYRWYASFVDFVGKPHEESGTVTLIK